VRLELGGKAPYVMFDDAEVDAAARAAVFGMFRNAGQACGATTRLLLQEGIHDRFLARVVALTRRIEVGPPARTRDHIAARAKKGREDRDRSGRAPRRPGK
jgi:acyl-CoA reductase-like NAD-dependent aldehyde dehydrogenase